MTSDTFWAATITDWVQAIGTVASVGVAAWATVVALQVRRTGAEVAQDLTETANESANRTIGTGSRVSWDIQPGGKYSRLIRNAGTTDAHVVAINNVSDGTRDALTVHETLPADVPANGTIVTSIERSMASPYVTRVEIIWTEEGEQFSQTYSVV